MSKAVEEERARLYREERSDAKIAERVGCCAQSVMEWRRARGLPARLNKLTPVERRRRIALDSLGMSDSDLGRAFGVRIGSVMRWRLRYGLSANLAPGGGGQAMTIRQMGYRRSIDPRIEGLRRKVSHSMGAISPLMSQTMPLGK